MKRNRREGAGVDEAAGAPGAAEDGGHAAAGDLPGTLRGRVGPKPHRVLLGGCWQGTPPPPPACLPSPLPYLEQFNYHTLPNLSIDKILEQNRQAWMAMRDWRRFS